MAIRRSKVKLLTVLFLSQAVSAARLRLDAVEFCSSVGTTANTVIPLLQFSFGVLSDLVESGNAKSLRERARLREMVVNSLVLANLRRSQLKLKDADVNTLLKECLCFNY